ncbi:MAG: hypothetical protein ABEJ77_04975 [Halanaeroarchaeum sp.]
MSPPLPGPSVALAGPGTVEALAALLGSLVVGGLAILAGTRLVADEGDLVRATFTAGVGALVWAFLDGIPVIGPLVAAVAWIALVRVRHDTGWLGATVAGFVAWMVAVVLAAALSFVGLPVTEVVGVPGA